MPVAPPRCAYGGVRAVQLLVRRFSLVGWLGWLWRSFVVADIKRAVVVAQELVPVR